MSIAGAGAITSGQRLKGQARETQGDYDGGAMPAVFTVTAPPMVSRGRGCSFDVQQPYSAEHMMDPLPLTDIEQGACDL